MPESAPRQKPLFRSGFPALETDGGPIYPEKRLWIAVICATVTEYESQLLRIKELWGQTGHRAIPKHYLIMLRNIRYEVRHTWFEHVCDIAGLDQSHVVAKLKQLDLKHGLAEVAFTDEDTMLSRYALRRLKKRYA